MATLRLPTNWRDQLRQAVDLIGRAGARQLEIGWDCPHTPDVPDGHYCAEVTWYAEARWRGARLFFDKLADPLEAVEALAGRVAAGAACGHCRRRIAWGISATRRPGICPWRVDEAGRWQPGCTIGKERRALGAN